MKKQEQNIAKEMGGWRHNHIKVTQMLAMKYERCNPDEMIDGKCTYPHCTCLYGKNGPIDPVTGKEMVRWKTHYKR
jgi:hypothetical protein